ncbi:hypothetical protein PQX77_020035 [Marasmius sp. AFHP31]|nr:hypothetical protein PQX77_020035 [Marasmius sp. AFHP31]
MSTGFSHPRYVGTVGNSVTHNDNTFTRGRLELYGRTYRSIVDGDILIQRHVFTEDLWVSPKYDQSESPEFEAMEVERTVQITGVFGVQGLFTAITIKPVDGNESKAFMPIAKQILQETSSWRSPLLTQVFALGRSGAALTLIVYGELVNGQAIIDQYRDKDWIVYYYLMYTQWIAMDSLRADNTLTIPVSNRWNDWFFALKNSNYWQYDLTSVCLSPPGEDSLAPSYSHPTPLPLGTAPPLTEIAACFERAFGDCLYLLAPFGGRFRVELSASTLVRHGLFTFGTVVDGTKPGVLAHFPFTPSPEWHCKSQDTNIEANYSSSVPSRVDLSFRKTSNIRLNLDFALCLPEEDLDRSRAAYLCQSLQHHDGCDDVENIVCIDHIGFSLQGTFPGGPTKLPTSAYLFVPPLSFQFTNNMYCLQYPIPDSLFYWCHDPEGKDIIAEEDWDKVGIPKLKVEMWVNSWWRSQDYDCVRDHLRSRNYNLDGRQYASDHGYPELIRGDPHDQRFIMVDEEEESITRLELA